VVLALVLMVSGAVLLGLELTASRVLAPAFGSSVEVWGAVLGAVLLALAVGYALGGRLADRVPRAMVLAATLATGAALIALVPVIDQPFLRFAARAGDDRVGALVAATIIFVLPAAFLAMSTPLAVRLCVRSLRVTGRTAGDLFAISTVGSIVGSLVTAFWLLPAFGVTGMLLVLASALGGAAALSAAIEMRTVPTLVIAGAAAIPALLVGGGFHTTADDVREAIAWTPEYRVGLAPRGAPPRLEGDLKLVHAEESRYHQISVADEPDNLRVLRFGRLRQSALNLDDPLDEPFEYVTWSHLGIAHAPDATRALVLGLGGGSAPRRFLESYAGLRVDAAEIDPAVVRVAQRYFRLPTDPRLTITVADGRRALDAHPGDLDMVLVDTFFADAIPFQMYTREFVELAHDRMRPGGAVVVNMHGSLVGEDSRLWRAVYKTYLSTFASVLVYPIAPGSPEVPQNVMLVATDRAVPSVEQLQATWSALRRTAPKAPDLTDAIESRWTEAVPLDDVPLLTDDFAPADALIPL
jgi:spermidine synthase